MHYRDWPRKIEGNMFTLATYDPEVPPVLKVVVWGNAFSAGGKVSIDGHDADGTRLYGDFGSITVDPDDCGRGAGEREHLQSVLDDFQVNLSESWSALVNDSREKVVAHYERQAKEARKKLAQAKKGVFK